MNGQLAHIFDFNGFCFFFKQKDFKNNCGPILSMP